MVYKRTHPQTNVKFEWGIDYSFVWNETAELKPGVIFEASQVLAADLQTSNSAVFDYTQDAFLITNASANEQAGSLSISETSKTNKIGKSVVFIFIEFKLEIHR